MAKSPSHSRERAVFYLICWLWNYPQAGGTRPIDDAEGQRLQFTESESKIENLVPLIPKTAYKPVTINDQTTYYATTFTARIETLGKVRIVVSFADPECQGTYAVLVTRQINWEAKRILRAYCGRF